MNKLSLAVFSIFFLLISVSGILAVGNIYGNQTNLEIGDNSDSEDVFVNGNNIFYANYTNLTDGSNINTGVCEIAFDMDGAVTLDEPSSWQISKTFFSYTYPGLPTTNYNDGSWFISGDSTPIQHITSNGQKITSDILGRDDLGVILVNVAGGPNAGYHTIFFDTSLWTSIDSLTNYITTQLDATTSTRNGLQPVQLIAKGIDADYTWDDTLAVFWGYAPGSDPAGAGYLNYVPAIPSTDIFGTSNLMPYNSTSKLFEYTDKFSNAGTFKFNVQCTDSSQVYETLTSTDDFVIKNNDDEPNDDDEDNEDDRLNINQINQYCEPNWECGSWSACFDGVQSRTCTDTNYCGEFYGYGKPSEITGCNIPTEEKVLVQSEGFNWLFWTLLVITLLLVLLIIFLLIMI